MALRYTPANAKDVYEAAKIFRNVLAHAPSKSQAVQDFLAPILVVALESFDPVMIDKLFEAVFNWAKEEPKLHDRQTAYEAMREHIRKMHERMNEEIFRGFYTSAHNGPGAKATFGDDFLDLDDLVGAKFTFNMNASGSEFQRSRMKRNPPPPPPPPPPAPPPLPDWRMVLGFPPGTRPTAEDIRLAYRRKAGRAHPDAGGSNREMHIVNDARDAALREIGAKT